MLDDHICYVHNYIENTFKVWILNHFEQFYEFFDLALLLFPPRKKGEEFYNDNLINRNSILK